MPSRRRSSLAREKARRMKLSRRIDEYVRDLRSQGRINSPATERSYRSILDRHCEDVLNRDLHYIGREDIKRTLLRWPNPNSQRVARAILVSFYDWAVEEGHLKNNPARQTRRPKRRPTSVYRLTRDEAAAMLEASRGDQRERWAIHLGILAGLRNAELRGLRGINFSRPGFVWVDSSIAKGGRERFIPVLPELERVAHEIRFAVKPDEYVLPAQRWRDAPYNRERMSLAKRPSSSQALRTLVMEIAARAGIQAHVHPHLLRHAFGDHVAKFAGMKNAQYLLGHATVATTEIYVGQPSLDELAAAVAGFAIRTPVLPLSGSGVSAEEATTGLEPVVHASRGLEPDLTRLLEGLAPRVALYAEAFGA
jgi:integrase/recombinase XerC